MICLADLAAWQSNHSSNSSSSGAFSWRGSVSSSSDSPPHASSATGTAGQVIPAGAGRKLKFRSATPSPPLQMSGSAPANFSGSLHKFHPAAANKGGHDDGIVSDESISECDEEPSPSQVTLINLLMINYLFIQHQQAATNKNYNFKGKV